MPYLPFKPCKHSGCGNYATKGSAYCTIHKPAHDAYQRRRKYDAVRDKSIHNLYGTAQWQRLREAHLLANPLCTDCLEQGRLTAATVVDHIKAHRGDRGLFYDPQNLRGLCESCHNKKTARQDGGFGNPIRDS